MTELTEVARVLNRMKAEGAVRDYAVGGAMAFLFYAEPLATYDLDVFVILQDPATKLLTLTSLYDWLRPQGFEPLGEHVLIHGVPVQFLASDALADEAVENALDLDSGGEPIRVVSPEHLIAMAVQAGGRKRRERVAHLLEVHAIDLTRVKDILRRHELLPRWESTWERPDD